MDDVMRRRSFTLLEVVIALVILSTFAVVTLQLRLDGLIAGRRIAQNQRTQHALDEVLELAVNAMLPAPAVERDDAGKIVRVTWRGDHLGEPFISIMEVVDVPAQPAPGNSTDAKGATPLQAPLRRYTATINGRTAVLLRPL